VLPVVAANWLSSSRRPVDTITVPEVQALQPGNNTVLPLVADCDGGEEKVPLLVASSAVAVDAGEPTVARGLRRKVDAIAFLYCCLKM